jgi:hypothetical protein
MVDYSFPEGLLTPLAVNHFQVTGYTLSPTPWALSSVRFLPRARGLATGLHAIAHSVGLSSVRVGFAQLLPN